MSRRTVPLAVFPELAFSRRQAVRALDVAEVALLEDGPGSRLHVGQDLAQQSPTGEPRQLRDDLEQSRRGGEALVHGVGQQSDRAGFVAVTGRLQQRVVEHDAWRSALVLHPGRAVGHPLDGDARRRHDPAVLVDEEVDRLVVARLRRPVPRHPVRIERGLPVRGGGCASQDSGPLALATGGPAGVVDVHPGMDRHELAAAEQAA